MAKQIALHTESQVNASLALKHRLFISRYDFCLSETLRDVRDGYYPEAKVVIHRENDIPVGVAVYDPDDNIKVQIFVRKSMRRKGIGSKLLLALDAPKGSTVGIGSKESKIFWSKQTDYKIFRNN